MGIAVFAVLSIFMRPVRITNCVAQEGRLLVTGRSGYELPVIYEELEDIEYRDEMDYGTPTDGVEDGREKSGFWENDDLGRYLLCVNTKVKPCIVLRTKGQIMVINFESDKSTRALYDALLEQMELASRSAPTLSADAMLSRDGTSIPSRSNTDRKRAASAALK